MKPWIGVDLDGTLAHYEEGDGVNDIGAPVPQMLVRVKSWLRRGLTVKILTARAGHGTKQVELIKAWLKDIGLPDLEVTDRKDHGMLELWDDRAVCVEHNTGRVIGRPEKGRV